MSVRYLIAALCLCLPLGSPAPADAEASGLVTLRTADDTKGWEAVGQLRIGTSGFCTAALIAPDLVLTAAHCLYDGRTLERVKDEDIRFLAGLRDGRARADRRVRRSAVLPDFVYTGPEGLGNTAQDVAIVQLSQPIRKTSVTPYETGSRPRKGATVTVVSYARNRATRPSLEEECTVLGRPMGTLVLNCDVDFGASGSPIFLRDEDGIRIVSVVSAMAEMQGDKVSLGTSLGDIVETLKQVIAEGGNAQTPATVVKAKPITTVVRSGLPGSGGSAFGQAGASPGGARFVKP